MNSIISKILQSQKKYPPDEIEQELNIPVFGTIPWLDKDVYDEPELIFTLDESISAYSLAYQQIMSCIKLKGNNLNRKVFAFTSTEQSKYRSTIIMNTAYSLSRIGESVIVVDADFRTPTIARDLGINITPKKDLTALLNNYPDDISLYLYSLQGINHFYVIPNNAKGLDPSIYLFSESFKLLIKELRTRYNWVFIDIPPALAVPDALMISSAIDGFILTTGLYPKKNVIKKIHKQFKTYGIKIFGIIMREKYNTEPVVKNNYLKQMIEQLVEPVLDSHQN